MPKQRSAKAFFYEFGQAVYRLDAFYAEFAKKKAVSPTLLWVLYALNDGKAHTQREICEDWALPKSTVNTLIQEMKSVNHVELEPIAGKRREMTIVLTATGKMYAEAVLASLYETEARVFADLSAEELQIADLLRRITHRLKSE